MGKDTSEAHDSPVPEKKSKTKKATDGGGCEPVLQEKRRKTSSALLDIPETPFAESLLVCKGETIGGFGSGVHRSNGDSAPPARPSIGPIPESNLLGTLRDFLPAMKAANDQLASRAAEEGGNLDIEVITGGEDAPHILMDVALGVAELRTPEAVAAAERAVEGKAVLEAPNENLEKDESDDDESEEEGTGHQGPLLREGNGKADVNTKRSKIEEM